MAKKKALPGELGWLRTTRRYVEGTVNAVTEMHMRGELADRPGGGVRRVANRWKPQPPSPPDYIKGKARRSPRRKI